MNSRANWVSDGTVKDFMASWNANNVLLVTDACFSGAIFVSKSFEKSNVEDINISYERKARIAMTAGNLETVPDRSIFINYFIASLEDNKNNYISSRTIYEDLFHPVKLNTPDMNEPQWGHIVNVGDENGDFIFFKK